MNFQISSLKYYGRLFFRELNSTLFHRFLTAHYDSVLSFFPARQVSEIIPNESSKSTKNALKRYNKEFPKIQSIRGFFGNKCSFQNWFWNLSSTSGLSHI
jgi:hypothetical protein